MKAQKGRQGLRPLNLVAYGLVSCAILFSLYCALHVNWSFDSNNALHGGIGRNLRAGEQQAPQKEVDSNGDLPPAGTPSGQQQQELFEKQIAKQNEITLEALSNIQKHLHELQEGQAHAPPAVKQIVTSAASVRNPRKYHLVTTCQGFANHWQARVHYYWYKKQREICEEAGVCDMGGFTRILHSGEADDLMDEIPTVVVDPLPAGALGNSSYVVLNRPYAFVEWLKKVSIPERYLIMGEADHLWMRPMPNLMVGEGVAAARFTYMVPEQYPDLVRKFVGPVSEDEVKKVPKIGNSPTMLSVKDFRALAPVWMNTTMDIFNDEEAHKAWSWVLEMYGYTLATYKLGQHKGLTEYPNMLAHPPFDTEELDYQGNPFYLLHLTYPVKYNSSGGMAEDDNSTVWKFDKRSYMEFPPPRNLLPPPANVNSTLSRLIISMFNEATDNIPCWDRYVKDKVVTTSC